MTTKPRGGVFHRQFFRILRKVIELEMKKRNLPARGRPSWRLAPRKAFDFRQVTPTPAPFSRRELGQVGAWLLAKPLTSVGSRQHRRRFPGAGPAKLASGSSQSLCLPSGHANTGAVFPAWGRPSWRLAPREAIFHRRATPTPAPWPRKTWCSATKE